MARRQVHVVYGYPPDVAPVGDAPIMGFGKSDAQALADAKSKGWAGSNRAPVYYFVRSNGDRVRHVAPVGDGPAIRSKGGR